VLKALKHRDEIYCLDEDEETAGIGSKVAASRRQ
jgi:hypothetical protein